LTSYCPPLICPETLRPERNELVNSQILEKFFIASIEVLMSFQDTRNKSVPAENHLLVLGTDL